MFLIQPFTRKKLWLLLTFETVSDYMWMTMESLNSNLYFILYVTEINSEIQSNEKSRSLRSR